jgi:hypothetical protein
MFADHITLDIENRRGEDRDFSMIAAASTVFIKIVLLATSRQIVSFEAAARSGFAAQT